MSNPYGVKSIDDSAAVYVTGPDGKAIADAGIARIFLSAEEANAYTEQCEGRARRIAASLNACEGVPTEDLERYYNTGAGIDKAMEEASLRDQLAVQKQRDQLLAALEDARRMLDIVADCTSHECEDCREHAAINRDKCAAAIAAAKGGAV